MWISREKRENFETGGGERGWIPEKTGIKKTGAI